MKIDVYITFAPFPECDTRYSYPAAAWESLDAEPVEGWISAEKWATVRAVQLHRADGGCPVSVNFQTGQQPFEWHGVAIRVKRSESFTIEASPEWLARFEAAALAFNQSPERSADDPLARRGESWSRLDFDLPVHNCLACGKVGVNALVGLCATCLPFAPESMRAAITKHAKGTRKGGKYDREHRRAMSYAAMAAIRARFPGDDFKYTRRVRPLDQGPDGRIIYPKREEEAQEGTEHAAP